MSQLDNLIDQARIRLLDLDGALKKAKALENTSNLTDSEMEQMRRSMGDSLAQLESIFENHLHRLAEAIEDRRCVLEDSSSPEQTPPANPSFQELLNEGREQFEKRDYEASIQTLGEAVKCDPTSQEARDALKEAQQKWEDQRLEEELVIHIENLKREAMTHFDNERFEECAGLFRFLCELEPQNRTLKDYFELSQQKAQELRGAAKEGETNAALQGQSAGGRRALPGAELHTEQHREEEPSPSPTPDGPVDDQAGPSKLQLEHTDGAPQIEKAAETAETPAAETQPADSPEQSAADASWSKRAVMVAMVLLALLFGTVLGWRLVRHSRNPMGSIEVQSEPSGANVIIDGDLKGQTPLVLESLPLGGYDLKIEKEGYALHHQTVQIENQQSLSLSVRLEKPAASWSEPANLQDEVRTGFKNMLMVSPRNPEAGAAAKGLKGKQKDVADAGKPNAEELKARIQELRQQLSAAVNSLNYFPPKTANAMDVIRQLNALSPDDAFAKDKAEQIYRDVLRQVQRKVQASDYGGANLLARPLQVYFAERTEFRNLRDALKTEERKAAELLNDSYQKAEAALAAGHLVTPLQDNVVRYCNHILSLDPQNARAVALKKQALMSAVNQAKEWTRNGEYDDARSTYQALLTLSQNESQFPFNPKDLKQEVDRLEFSGFAVMHDHTLGNCTGRLRVNGYVITYIPSSDTKDGFTQKLSDIVQLEPGDKLKIQFKNKTYRFHANAISSKEENRQKIEVLYRKLRLLMGQ